MGNSLGVQARRDFWIAHVRAWQQSGLTQSAYCQQHDLIASRMSYWVCQTKERDKSHSTVSFVPATLLPMPLDTSLSLKSPSGWQLTLPAKVAPEWIAQLLQQLP
jgi:hypothetical protein